MTLREITGAHREEEVDYEETAEDDDEAKVHPGVGPAGLDELVPEIGGDHAEIM